AGPRLFGDDAPVLGGLPFEFRGPAAPLVLAQPCRLGGRVTAVVREAHGASSGGHGPPYGPGFGVGWAVPTVNARCESFYQLATASPDSGGVVDSVEGLARRSSSTLRIRAACCSASRICSWKLATTAACPRWRARS